MTTLPARGRPASPTRSASHAWVDGCAWTLRVAAIATLFGAELIHISVMNAHYSEWFWAGTFFLVISVVEGLLGAALIFMPSRRLCLVAAVTSLGTVVVWAVSRTSGLPFGPAAGLPERIGRADSMSALFEMATAVALVSTCTATIALRRASRMRITAVVVTVIAVLTVVALRPSSGSVGHGDHAELRRSGGSRVFASAGD